jgi:hypothetical protein
MIMPFPHMCASFWISLEMLLAAASLNCFEGRTSFPPNCKAPKRHLPDSGKAQGQREELKNCGKSAYTGVVLVHSQSEPCLCFVPESLESCSHLHGMELSGASSTSTRRSSHSALIWSERRFHRKYH